MTLRTTSKSWRVAPAALVALLWCVDARAQAREDQVVLDWNVTALQVAPPGNATVRAMAMVHVAVFDAVNAIDPQYRPYLSLPPVTAAVDKRAAAAAAAYGVLVRLHPTQQPALALALAASLASIPDGPEKTAGLALGDQVAVAMIARRAADNFFLPNPVYVPGTGPAAYQLTPPAFANPQNQNASLFVPFVMTHNSQFRPNGPPHLDSHRFVREYDEVRTLGIACPNPAVCARTPEQTQIALWHNEQGQRQLSRIARILTLEGPANLLDTARNFALLGLAMGDGFVSAFEAIYAFRFVRPVTAIRAGDADGVPGTIGDTTWTPHFVTPTFPEYPSIRAVASAAGAKVIKNAFGRHTSFDTTAPSVPGVTRHFEDIDAFVADGQLAEIYQGIHFRTAVVHGRKQGKKVGKRVLQRALRPLDHDDDDDDDDHEADDDDHDDCDDN